MEIGLIFFMQHIIVNFWRKYDLDEFLTGFDRRCISNYFRQVTQRAPQSLSVVFSTGFSVFVVGVADVDTAELRNIGSKPSERHIFIVDDFDAFTKIQDNLITFICETATSSKLSFFVVCIALLALSLTLKTRIRLFPVFFYSLSFDLPRRIHIPRSELDWRLSIIIVLFSSVITHCYASLDGCFDENLQASGCWKPLTSLTRCLLAWTASPWNLAPSTVTLHTDSIRMHSFPSPQSRLKCSACVLHVFWAAPLQTVMAGKQSQLF